MNLDLQEGGRGRGSSWGRQKDMNVILHIKLLININKG